jgi:DNA polymerase III subunit epsilon
MLKELFLDTETTGLDYRQHGVIQIAGAIRIDDEIKEKFDLLGQPMPGKLIEQKALAVNKRTPQEIEKFKSGQELYKDFIGILGEYIDKYDRADKFHLIGYNIRFDEDFLRQLFMDNQDVYWGSWVYYPPIDVMNLVAVKVMKERSELPNFKLGTVAERYEIKAEGDLHDAGTDIEITMKLFDKIRKMK